MYLFPFFHCQVAAELAIFRVFREQPQAKVVYIAPLKVIIPTDRLCFSHPSHRSLFIGDVFLKALVRERVDDWKARMETQLGKKVVELTGS